MLLPTSLEHCRNRWALSKSVAVNIPPCCIQGGLGEGGGREEGGGGVWRTRSKEQNSVQGDMHKYVFTMFTSFTQCSERKSGAAEKFQFVEAEAHG